MKGIVFDMDGVIVDSEPHHICAFEEVFDEMGYGDSHGIRFEDYVGRSDRAVWDDFIQVHKPDYSLERLTHWKQDRVIEILKKTEPLFEGLPELVASLSGTYPLGLASGSLHAVIDPVLDMGDLRRHFRTVVSVEDVGQPKPAPDVYLKAVANLGLEPAHCLAIEDSKFGIESALAAGMSVVAITNSFPKGELSKANGVVESYSELAEWIAQNH